jgi:predicted transcriptional regulator
MNVLIEIQDNKAEFILELLNSFSFVKATALNSEDRVKLSKEERKAIEKGLQDLAEGRVLSDSQVMEETRTHFRDLFN